MRARDLRPVWVVSASSLPRTTDVRQAFDAGWHDKSLSDRIGDSPLQTEVGYVCCTFSAAIRWTRRENRLQPQRSFADADRRPGQERSRTAASNARDLILTTQGERWVPWKRTFVPLDALAGMHLNLARARGP